MVVSVLERFEASVANVELHVSTLNVVTKCVIDESIFDAFHPDGWFSERLFEWQQTFQDWRNLQRDWKDAGRRGSLQDVAAASPFCSFAYEDWALLNIRLELHLLMVAFRQGSDNTAESCIPIKLLPTLYKKGFNKQFILANYGVSEFSDFVDIINDTVIIRGGKLQPKLGPDSEPGLFVQLTETHRRVRTRRFDAGDESVLLKLRAGLVVRPTAQQ